MATTRTQAPAWQVGDFATFEDRFRRTRTGMWTGQTETQTTRLSATGEAIQRKVPVTFASILTDPAQAPDHPGRGQGMVSVDVRKLRRATPQEIAASAVRQGWEACERRAARADAWWAAAQAASDYLKANDCDGMVRVDRLILADQERGRRVFALDGVHWVARTPAGAWEFGEVPA